MQTGGIKKTRSRASSIPVDVIPGRGRREEPMWLGTADSLTELKERIRQQSQSDNLEFCILDHLTGQKLHKSEEELSW